MISEANQVALQAAGLSFILGARIPYLPDVVRKWGDKHSEETIPDGLVLTQPWPYTSAEKIRSIPDRVIHYQYRHDHARHRTSLRIDLVPQRMKPLPPDRPWPTGKAHAARLEPDPSRSGRSTNRAVGQHNLR
jgi:hypothetical protein